MQPVPVQLLDSSIAKKEEGISVFAVEPELTDASVAKNAEGVQGNTMSRLKSSWRGRQNTNSKQRMDEKLARLEKEVKLGHQHLSQTKTLMRSKEALLRKKVRVTYNN